MESSANLSVLLTGATGFTGRPLVEHLARAGHRCTLLSRRAAPPDGWQLPDNVVLWAYDKRPWPAADAVINLAGESIIGLWTKRKRARILESRTGITRQLVEWMGESDVRPAVFVSASAVGYYGDRPGETLTEDSEPDPRRGFRFQVCHAWEMEASRAEELHGIRTVLLRIGNVLHPSGGYLARIKAVKSFPLVPGSEDVRVSWISLEDLIRLVADAAIPDPRYRGPVNAVSPEPTTQARLIKAIAGRRPYGRVPSPLIRAVLGEFSTAVLDDQHVVPSRAIEFGFKFRHPNLEQYLKDVSR